MWKSTEAPLDALVEVEKLVAGGVGLARMDSGQVAFVRGVLPGEQVLARLEADTGKTLAGYPIEIKKKSRLRVVVDCSLDGRCGGCDWLHVEPGAAPELKLQILREALGRAGISGIPDGAVHASPAGRPSRARARFHLTAEGDVGFLGSRSHEVVPLQTCPALRPALSCRIADIAAAACEAAGAPSGAAAGALPAQLLAAADDRHRIVVTPLDRRGRPLPAASCPALTRALERRGIECAGPGDGAAPLRYDGPALEQQAAVGGFVQANPEANQGLVRRVLELAGPPGRAVDYFCGAGNFGLPLARAGWQVRGLELDAAAVALGRRRAAELGVPASFETANLEQAPPPPGDADLAVMDPTRRGARALARALAGSAVPRVLHVGCDPATMARDGAVLAGADFRLTVLELFDFFPGTHHAEALGLWVRGG